MGCAAEVIEPVEKISVREAIRQATARAKRVGPPAAHSHWLAEVIPLKGRKRKSVWAHNLATDSATGYTNRRTWQARAMGLGPSFAFATATGTSTAVGATSLTNSGASFPTAGTGLAGQVVVTGNRYGVIVSNTATVLTIDQWYDPTSASGAAGSTPATGVYVILPGQAPAAWLGVTQDAVAPAATDTALTAELTTSGFSRSVGTFAHTAGTSSYTLTRLFTATGTATINKSGIFGAANPTAGGVMPFVSAVPSPPTLISGDTLNLTATVTIG
jgi:hypothetical protein